jgi:hypothetical protein
MNLTELQILKANILGQLTNKLISPLCLAGSPGTAKSTTVALVAAELGMHISTESAPCMTHEILSGLPSDYDAPDYQANSIDGSMPKATAWSIPEMVSKAIHLAKDKPTILLIDDFHMVSPHLQAYFYGLLLERRLGNFKLSDNIAIILTMNDSQLAGFNGINSAVRNRMSILNVTFNFEHWFTGYGNRLHYLVASFLKAKPHYCQEDESTGIEGYATARAWTAIAAELSFHTNEFCQANARTLAGTQVSTQAAQAFQAHVTYIAAIDFTKLVSKRTIVDLSKQDPLDSIIYSYITNFIQTVDDALYLFELLNANLNNSASAFIGFVMGELYVKFTHQSELIAPLSDGLRFALDILIGKQPNHSEYPNTSRAKLTAAIESDVQGIKELMKQASEFIM